MDDARAAQRAGAFAVVLECIPAELASRITAELEIPTIGIGAGAGCDGQILVVNDLLGITGGKLPRHVKTYANLSETIQGAVAQFRDEVRESIFPDERHEYR